MELQWKYTFRARDQSGKEYMVRNKGNTWTWFASVTGQQGEQSLGQFGTGEDAKKACEEAASKQ